MKIYSFEIEGYHEYYDLRIVKKKALEIAKKLNKDVLITCIHTPSYKQDWYTMSPNGILTTDGKGLKFIN